MLQLTDAIRNNKGHVRMNSVGVGRVGGGGGDIILHYLKPSKNNRDEIKAYFF